MNTDWIDVAEVLPEQWQKVIAYGVTSNGEKVVSECILRDNNKFYAVKHQTIRKVTHWQPLPAAPELKGE